MIPPEKGKVMKEGTFRYDSERSCKVRIVQVGFRPGSGDFEDSENWREDRHGTFYRIDYTSPHSLEFTAGGGYSPTLEEAIQFVERSVQDVEWQE
jgi:hypothetical protein